MNSPWLECETDDGDIYYWNSETDESLWEPPPSFVPLKQTRKILTNQASNSKNSTPVQVQQQPKVQSKSLPPDWVECQDNEGSTYYWNSRTDESSWDFPQVAPSKVSNSMPTKSPVNSKAPSGENPLTKGIRNMVNKTKEVAKQLGETSRGSSCTQCGNIVTGKFCPNCGTPSLSMSYENSKSGMHPQGPEAEFARILKENNVRQDVIATLINQKVSTENMRELTQDILKDEFGITVWGDRVAILNAVQAYLANGSKPSPKPVAPSAPSNIAAKSTGSRLPPAPTPVPSTAGRALSPSPGGRNPPTSPVQSTTWSAPQKADVSVSEPVLKSALSPEQEEEKRLEAEKKKAEERKKRDRENAKKEDEFFKNNERQGQLAQIQQKKHYEAEFQKQVDPSFCEASFDVVGYQIHKKNGKPDFVTFEIKVFFGGSSWTIHRRWSQVNKMDAAFKKEIVGYVPFLPPKPQNYKQVKFEDYLQKERRAKLHEYMQIVNNARPAIFNAKVSRDLFTKFTAPCQMGDKKDPNCVVPFKLTL